ncbi:MAG: mechanosensitive ion channel family protein [Gammaproteobacteria bacterium]|nr:mechanosensitive ion channel family protein [Gammaproteobacteria bacterium]
MMEKIINLAIEGSVVWVPKLATTIFILIIFFVISKIIKKVIGSAAKRLQMDNHLTLLLARTSSIILLIVGLVTALGTLGIDVSAIVAGLGLTGFALGFALKDIISNLLSGILILLYQPFKVGNTIKISGFEGEVVAIDLRYTELNSDGNKVLMPNSKLFTDPITVIDVMACVDKENPE